MCAKRRDHMSAHAETGAWQNRQRQTLTSYTPPDPALPSNYSCPTGACSAPPPPNPLQQHQQTKEGFTEQRLPRNWLVVMSAAALVFVALTRLIKAN